MMMNQGKGGPHTTDVFGVEIWNTLIDKGACSWGYGDAQSHDGDTSFVRFNRVRLQYVVFSKKKERAAQ